MSRRLVKPVGRAMDRREAMRTVVGATGGAVFAGTALAASGSEAQRFPRNADEYDRMMTQTRNWGRWGSDDEVGAVNLITPAKRREAAQLVRSGVSVSFSHPMLKEPAPDNPAPFEQTMSKSMTADTYKMTYHGMVMSHFDAFCHKDYRKQHYNGVPFEGTNTPDGCTRLSVEPFRNGVVSRGILYDIPRLKNLPWLEPGTPIFVEDLEAWEKKAGVRVSSGDIFYLRTGRWPLREKRGPWNFRPGGEPVAGLHASVVPWLRERGVAVLGSDAVADVLPSRIEGVFDPVHIALIAGLGVPLLDNQDPEAVAQTAARLKRWEFMTSIAPLVVPGGTGSPVNALAIF